MKVGRYIILSEAKCTWNLFKCYHSIGRHLHILINDIKKKHVGYGILILNDGATHQKHVSCVRLVKNFRVTK